MKPEREDWPQKIAETARQCQTASTGATAAFFEGFADSMAGVGERSPGNRTFMAGAIERGLLAAALGMDLQASRSPALKWREPEKAFVKRLDLLMWASGPKCVAIEVKGRGFDGIASACSQFALANRCAESLVAGKGQNDFAISKSDTHFMLVLGDFNARSKDTFEILRGIHDDTNTSFSGIFLDTDVNGGNIEAVCQRASRMLERIADFLDPRH